MDNFDLKKYLAEGKLLKEEVEKISAEKTIKKDMPSTATKEASKMVGIAIGKLGLEKQLRQSR